MGYTPFVLDTPSEIYKPPEGLLVGKHLLWRVSLPSFALQAPLSPLYPLHFPLPCLPMIEPIHCAVKRRELRVGKALLRLCLDTSLAFRFLTQSAF